MVATFTEIEKMELLADYAAAFAHAAKLVGEEYSANWRKANKRVFYAPTKRKAKQPGRLCWSVVGDGRGAIRNFVGPIVRKAPFVSGYHPKMNGFIVPTLTGTQTVDVEPMTTPEIPQPYMTYEIPLKWVQSDNVIQEYRQTVQRVIVRDGKKDTIEDVQWIIKNREVQTPMVTLSNRCSFIDGMTSGESDKIRELRENANTRWTTVRICTNPKSDQYLEPYPVGRLVKTVDGRFVPDLMVESWEDDGNGIRFDSVIPYLRSAISKQWRAMLEQFRPGLNLYPIRREFIQEALQSIALHHFELLRGISQFRGICFGLHQVCKVFLLRYGVKRKSNAEKGLENDFENARKVNRGSTVADVLKKLDSLDYPTYRSQLITEAILRGEDYVSAARMANVSEQTARNDVKSVIEFNRV